MQISKHTVVTIDYTLSNDAGEVLDSSSGKDPLTYLHGVGSIVEGLERALEGHAQGDELRVRVPPSQGYGERDEDLVGVVDRRQIGLDEQLEVGMLLQVVGANDQREVVQITGIQEDEVTLDGNHPLAGETLIFEVSVVEVRDATPEEIDHGHAHGAGGHHQHG